MGGARIVLFHDYFAIRGGGERLVLSLARACEGSVLVSGFRTSDSYEKEAFPETTVFLNLHPSLRTSGFRLPALVLKFWRQRSFAAAFPIRIFSGVAAPFSAPKADGGINIFYCHTPPRFLYDQRAYFLGRQGFFKRLAAYAVMGWFKPGYLHAVERMDLIVTNSQNTRDRIRRYLGKDSMVVYPPVDTDRFAWRGQGDYYLSTARLTPLKRVQCIVEAFLAMPDKRLIVASGGEELARLKSLAAEARNIEFRGWISDEELLELVGNAIATIYLPKDEDFGMSPVESMAAGKPVIGVAEGGLLETILPDCTGILLDKNFTVADLMKAVQAMTPEKANTMRQACETRAGDFTRDRFLANIKSIVDRVFQQTREPR